VHPSYTTRNPVQVEEARKKRKYVMEDPFITLIEDDVELFIEAQREESMAKIIEVHETLQQVRIQAVPQATAQQKEKKERKQYIW
jgi:hypothetical protein